MFLLVIVFSNWISNMVSHTFRWKQTWKSDKAKFIPSCKLWNIMLLSQSYPKNNFSKELFCLWCQPRFLWNHLYSWNYSTCTATIYYTHSWRKKFGAGFTLSSAFLLKYIERKVLQTWQLSQIPQSGHLDVSHCLHLLRSSSYSWGFWISHSNSFNFKILQSSNN